MCCEFAQWWQINLTSFITLFCQCDWYLFPLEIQRMLLIFISSTQQPGTFYGYGQIEGSRETFKAVNFIEFEFDFLLIINMIRDTHNFFHFSFCQTIKNGFSYSMMLRQIDG